MLKIIADRNLYKLQDFLPHGIEVTYYNPMEPIDLPTNTSAWLLNTVTKVNPANFPALPNSLKFIGTGSSGSDHLDKKYLTEQGINFDDAKGCNAQAVAEYVLTALFLLKEEKSVSFEKKRIGIIGVGAVGTRVNQLLEKLGTITVLYDPPRAQRDPDFKSATIEELLSCDIITFHTPFVVDGEYPTHYWLDEKKLSGRNFDVIINTARGGIINEKALLHAYRNSQISHIITDVWENEPNFNSDLAHTSYLATPHIAGYSEQSKMNASRIISKKFCQFFGLTPPQIPTTSNAHQFDISNSNYNFRTIINTINPILEYDKNLRIISKSPDKKNKFIGLRNNTPLRQEYRVVMQNSSLINKNYFLNLFD